MHQSAHLSLAHSLSIYINVDLSTCMHASLYMRACMHTFFNASIYAQHILFVMDTNRQGMRPNAAFESEGVGESACARARARARGCMKPHACAVSRTTTHARSLRDTCIDGLTNADPRAQMGAAQRAWRQGGQCALRQRRKVTLGPPSCTAVCARAHA